MRVAASANPADLCIEEIWDEADRRERRIIAADLLDEVRGHPDGVELEVSGAPRVNVLDQEVG